MHSGRRPGRQRDGKKRNKRKKERERESLLLLALASYQASNHSKADRHARQAHPAGSWGLQWGLGWCPAVFGDQILETGGGVGWVQQPGSNLGVQNLAPGHCEGRRGCAKQV